MPEAVPQGIKYTQAVLEPEVNEVHPFHNSYIFSLGNREAEARKHADD